MKVLVVCATDYPDMDEVRKRLEVGTKRDGVTTLIRKGDRKLKTILEDLSADYKVYTPPEDWHDYNRTGDAYNANAANDADLIIVYHTPKSGVTSFFVKRAPLARALGARVEIIEKKSRVVHTRKGRKPDA